MERTGEVTALFEEYIEVTFCRPADCEKCQACRGGEKTTKLVVRGKANLGDLAVVEMPTSRVMLASGLAYGVPLAGLFIGLFAGSALAADQNIGAAVGAVAGLGLAMLAVKGTERFRRGNPAWQPKLIDVIPMNKA